MMEFGADSYSDAELRAEFGRLFPQGFAGADVVRGIAPEGWEHSPLVAVFHPSLEQVYEEALRFHRRICELRRADDERPLPAEPTLEEVRRDFRQTTFPGCMPWTCGR